MWVFDSTSSVWFSFLKKQNKLHNTFFKQQLAQKCQIKQKDTNLKLNMQIYFYYYYLFIFARRLKKMLKILKENYLMVQALQS